MTQTRFVLSKALDRGLRFSSCSDVLYTQLTDT
jgi:hypothetical protein